MLEGNFALGKLEFGGRIFQRMGLNDDTQRVVDGADLLHGIDQRQRQIPRAVQYAERQRADQHHIPCRHGAGHPEIDGPDQHAPRHKRQADVMQNAGFFQIHPAAPLGPGFVANLMG